jgi:hypothetical protein
MITSSRKQWTSDGLNIKDAFGNVIGQMFDYRDADLVVESVNDLEFLKTSLEEKEDRIADAQGHIEKSRRSLSEIQASLEEAHEHLISSQAILEEKYHG